MLECQNNGRCKQITMERYKIDILGISEIETEQYRWDKLGSCIKILYYGNRDEDANREKIVAFMLSKKVARSLMEWKGMSEKIMWCWLKARCKNMTIINVYASTNTQEDGVTTDFYEQVHAVYHKLQTDKVQKKYNINYG